MAKVYIVSGDSGTGKSTSVENLDPKETFVINCLGKSLPFRGSSKMYSKAKANMISASTSGEVVSFFNAINTKQLHIKNVIVDDAGTIMSELFFKKALEVGYTKFSEIAQGFQKILSDATRMRNDLNVVFMLHDEDEMSNSIKTKKKIKTVGKLLDDQFNPLITAAVALWTDVAFDKDGIAQYSFITNRTVVQGMVVPAKSPRGMFDQLRIPNDLKLVFEAADRYYNGEEAYATEPVDKAPAKTTEPVTKVEEVKPPIAAAAPVPTA